MLYIFCRCYYISVRSYRTLLCQISWYGHDDVYLTHYETSMLHTNCSNIICNSIIRMIHYMVSKHYVCNCFPMLFSLLSHLFLFLFSLLPLLFIPCYPFLYFIFSLFYSFFPFFCFFYFFLFFTFFCSLYLFF